MEQVVKGVRWDDGIELEDKTVIIVTRGKNNKRVKLVIQRDSEIGKINIVRRKEDDNEKQ